MASIAAVVKKTDRGMQLEANRVGSCAQCGQAKQCAVQWHITDKTHSLIAPNFEHIEDKEQVQLQCNDRVLLLYIALLFLPSLFLLIVTTLVISYLLPDARPAFQFVVMVLLPLLFGSFFSHRLLKRFSKTLSSATKIVR